jgi:hypothetical protein
MYCDITSLFVTVFASEAGRGSDRDRLQLCLASQPERAIPWMLAGQIISLCKSKGLLLIILPSLWIRGFIQRVLFRRVRRSSTSGPHRSEPRRPLSSLTSESSATRKYCLPQLPGGSAQPLAQCGPFYIESSRISTKASLSLRGSQTTVLSLSLSGILIGFSQGCK